MSKKQKEAAPNQNKSSNPSTDQPISGRLHGSGTELEQSFDARHDISSVDQQEGNMNHGTKGGCFDEAEEVVKRGENQ